MKNLLFIIASEGFRDAEYFVPAQMLREAGHQISLASDIDAGKQAKGADGAQTIVDYNINDIDISNFDAIVFVGGPGALKHLDNDTCYKIAQTALEKNKLLAAICIAPVILAKAGVLKDKNATVWTDETDKSASKILEENGAKYTDQPVVKDNVVTANGPDAAEIFGQTLKQILWQSSAI